MGEITALHWPSDGGPVLNLCKRASDYVRLETGGDPEMAYVVQTMTQAPDSIPPEHTWCWGDTSMNGAIDSLPTNLKVFYRASDWYLGLLLIAADAHGQGLGARMAQLVITQARADEGTCLRVAVLDSNPRARAFWTRLGLAHEKSTSQGDGQMRHIHRLTLKENQP